MFGRHYCYTRFVFDSSQNKTFSLVRVLKVVGVIVVVGLTLLFAQLWRFAFAISDVEIGDWIVLSLLLPWIGTIFFFRKNNRVALTLLFIPFLIITLGAILIRFG